MMIKNSNNQNSLICIGGLPGVGKTTLGRKIQSNISNSIHICPDRMWLKCIGKDGEQDVLTDADIHLDMAQNVIEEMKAETHKNLLEGKTVIVASAFMLESMRLDYEDIAAQYTIPFYAFWLEADVEVRFERAQKRLKDHGKIQNDKFLKDRNFSAVSADKIRHAKIDGVIEWPIIDAIKSPDEIYETIWQKIESKK